MNVFIKFNFARGVLFFFAFWPASLEKTLNAVFALKVRGGLSLLHFCTKRENNNKKKKILRCKLLSFLNNLSWITPFFFVFVFCFSLFAQRLCLPANDKTKPLLLLAARQGDLVAPDLRRHTVSNKALIRTLSIIKCWLEQKLPW